MNIIKIVMPLLLLVTIQASSNGLLESVKKKIKQNEPEKAAKILKTVNPSSLTHNDLAYYHFLQGEVLHRLNKESDSYKHYLLSKKQYLQLNNTEQAMEITLKLAEMANAQEKNTNASSKFFNDYLAYAKKINDSLKLTKGYALLAADCITKGEYEKSLKFYQIALSYSNDARASELISAINTNIANLYNEAFSKPDSALYYLKKDLIYLKKINNPDNLYHNYINQAASYHYKGDYRTSNEYLGKADSLPLKNYTIKAKQYLYEVFYQNYEALNDYQNAYKYLALARKFADSINTTEQNIAINDIQTKYQTKEKELENTKLKNNIATNRILLYTSIGILLAVAAIALLLVKNARRKEKISKQEKLIEQQKLEKALKDYEINSIDMMLEGQEKERQRIANDLHDNLGSMLATLKLNFENLKLRKSELRDEETKLYERTDELIEEAYQKVRRLAHAKNAGVLATEGLIPAIKKLAEKISIPGKLQMQVVSFGFNDRLDNTIEIMIFRAVQELGTNIIKHSQATEATIHLTHHDDIINIIIEDNGIGFKSSELQMNDGMGLQAIRKKVEQLGGTFTIDSMPGKGTTILIDIPV